MEDKLEEIKQKYPEIAKMTVKDVVESVEFETAFKEAWKTAWEKVRDYEAKLKIISRHPIRILRAKKMFEIDNFRKEYLAVINKQSNLSASQRQTISVIGSMAYTKTIKNLMDKYDDRR